MMKKKTIIFILLIIVAIMIIFAGFICYALASIPLQDMEMAPSTVLNAQANEIMIGKIMMLSGVILLAGDIIWKAISGKKSEK